jgi:hypothetical protein
MTWEVVAAALGGATIGFLGALVVAWQQARSALERLNAEHLYQITVSKRQKQQQVFSQLMGQKFMTPQLFFSGCEATISFGYHQARWKLAGEAPQESLDFQEAQRWLGLSTDLTLKIAENNKTLFEIIGLIRILFPTTPELDERINAVYHFETLTAKAPPTGADAGQLEAWKTNGVKRLHDLVQNAYAKPIEDLLNYLASELSQ